MVTDAQTSEVPIVFLGRFVETKNRVNLSPILVSLKIEETKLGREMYADKISPVDAIEFIRSFVIAKRLPMEVSIYPVAVIGLQGGIKYKVTPPSGE